MLLLTSCNLNFCIPYLYLFSLVRFPSILYSRQKCKKKDTYSILHKYTKRWIRNMMKYIWIYVFINCFKWMCHVTNQSGLKRRCGRCRWCVCLLHWLYTYMLKVHIIIYHATHHVYVFISTILALTCVLHYTPPI